MVYRKRFLEVCGYVCTMKHLDVDKMANDIFGVEKTDA